MKKIIILVTILLVFDFVKVRPSTFSATLITNSIIVDLNPNFNYIKGNWTGTLKDKPLKLVIEKIQGNTAYGYNIYGSNKRPLKGTISEIPIEEGAGECGGQGSFYRVTLNEPGDKAGDGIFTLDFRDCPTFMDDGETVQEHSYSAYGKYKSFDKKYSGQIHLIK